MDYLKTFLNHFENENYSFLYESYLMGEKKSLDKVTTLIEVSENVAKKLIKKPSETLKKDYFLSLFGIYLDLAKLKEEDIFNVKNLLDKKHFLNSEDLRLYETVFSEERGFLSHLVIVLYLIAKELNIENHHVEIANALDSIGEDLKTQYDIYFIDLLKLNRETGKVILNVTIYIEDTNLEGKLAFSLVDSLDEYLQAIGFEYLNEDSPIYGSFFQKLKFWSKDPKTIDEAVKMLDEGREALRANYLDKPTAEATGVLATSTSELIKSLDSFDSVAIRLGTILIVKIKEKNESHLAVETISPKFKRLLEDDPSLLKNPKQLFEKLKAKSLEGEP